MIWHTQGLGNSLSIAFYAGYIIRKSAMESSAVVVLTDRNDLDDLPIALSKRSANGLTMRRRTCSNLRTILEPYGRTLSIHSQDMSYNFFRSLFSRTFRCWSDQEPTFPSSPYWEILWGKPWGSGETLDLKPHE